LLLFKSIVMDAADVSVVRLLAAAPIVMVLLAVRGSMVSTLTVLMVSDAST